MSGLAELMDAPEPGGLGELMPVIRWRWHRLAVLDIIEEEKLCDRASRLGAELVEVLEKAKATCPALVDVRARGSMVAAEFNDPATGKPSAELTKHYLRKALDAGLLMLSCGVHGNVIASFIR